MLISGKNILVFVAMLILSMAMPATRIETDPELTAGFEEGDMVLDMNKRIGLIDEVRRWPNATVFYKFFTQFDEPHKNHILRAMKILESISCIRFVEANYSVKSFVNITGFDDGCYSSVGYLNNGGQVFNLKVFDLDVGCFRLGSIIHEFMHTLGFFHMQGAPNRNEYVRIVEENVKEGNLHNFRMHNESYVDDFDEKYDYASILHYPPYAFSVNGQRTIIPLKQTKDSNIMGQRRVMRRSDINRLNVMYRCPVAI